MNPAKGPGNSPRIGNRPSQGKLLCTQKFPTNFRGRSGGVVRLQNRLDPL